MLLVALILFLILNATISGVLTVLAFDKQPGDAQRRGLLILSVVLLANTTAFLTIYAYYTHGNSH